MVKGLRRQRLAAASCRTITIHGTYFSWDFSKTGRFFFSKWPAGGSVRFLLENSIEPVGQISRQL